MSRAAPGSDRDGAVPPLAAAARGAATTAGSAATKGPASGSPAPPGLVNVANALTVLRLALVPVFVSFLVAGA